MEEKTWKIAIVNGPNLNLLGERNPAIYGAESFESFLGRLREDYPGVDFTYFQSNIEGEIIDFIQKVRHEIDGFILNAGAYSHTSIALGDCLEAVNMPVIEVHISNVYARESFRRESKLAPHVMGSITGLGLKGYEWATLHFLSVWNR